MMKHGQMAKFFLYTCLVALTTGVSIGNIDLMFVVDGSDSIGRERFETIKDWIINVSKRFDITEKVQIGVVQYSHWYRDRSRGQNKWINTEITLGQYHDHDLLANAVKNISYHGYSTYTAHAIRKTVIEDFKGETGRYPKAHRVMILITDGEAADNDVLPSAIKLAKEEMVNRFAVGVGNYNRRELRLIAGSKERVIGIDSFDKLIDTAPIISEAVKDFESIGNAIEENWNASNSSSGLPSNLPSSSTPSAAVVASASVGAGILATAAGTIIYLLKRRKMRVKSYDRQSESDTPSPSENLPESRESPSPPLSFGQQ